MRNGANDGAEEYSYMHTVGMFEICIVEPHRAYSKCQLRLSDPVCHIGRPNYLNLATNAIYSFRYKYYKYLLWLYMAQEKF